MASYQLLERIAKSLESVDSTLHVMSGKRYLIPTMFGIHLGEQAPDLIEDLKALLLASATSPERPDCWFRVEEFVGKLEYAHIKAKRDGVI
jgi:hypothetical protein